MHLRKLQPAPGPVLARPPQPIAPCPFPAMKQPKAAPVKAAGSLPADAGEPGGSCPWDTPLKDPGVLYPQKAFTFQRPPPKESLKPIQQDGTATPLALNLIEAIHWASFPLGFFVAGIIAMHPDKMLDFAGQTAPNLPPLPLDPLRHYLLVLGMLGQVFGGIPGNMMHMYEGWQVVPFRNPVPLEGALDKCGANPTCVKDTTALTFIDHYNNGWLRVVTYQVLFFFQAVGMCLFTTAALGVNAVTASTMALIVFVGLVGPREPMIYFNLRFKLPYKGPGGETLYEERPVLPLPRYFLFTFVGSALVYVYATYQYFGTTMLRAWPVITGLVTPANAAAAGALYAFLLMWWSKWRWVAVAVGTAVGTLAYAIIHYPGPWWGALAAAALVGLGWLWKHATGAGVAAGVVTALYAVAHLVPDVGIKLLSLSAPLFLAGGAMFEGIVAESTFNQWMHWISFVLLFTGLGVYGVLYGYLVWG